jgi:RNA polymerase sigma-70 factor (ECF subfamily)
MTTPEWDHCVRELGPPLLRYFSALHAPSVAADFVQETLLRLVRKVEGGAFDASRGSLRMYAFGIARRVRLEHFDDLVPSEPFHEEAVPSHEDRLIKRERSHRLRRAISRLPEAQRDIVLLLLDRELTLADIATLTAQPLNTVKSHVHRAKERLRELLQEE